LGEWRRNQVGASDQKLIVDADSVHVHSHTAQISLIFMDENDMMKAPHLFWLPLISFGLATLSNSSAELNFPIGLCDAVV
jgi:hypothetical protein